MYNFLINVVVASKAIFDYCGGILGFQLFFLHNCFSFPDQIQFRSDQQSNHHFNLFFEEFHVDAFLHPLLNKIYLNALFTDFSY